MKPLVKWAGGKRQILPQIMDHLPEKWDHYYEPFAGGLALLVELFDTGQMGKSIVSDVNPELINLYLVVKKSPLELLETIENLHFRNDEAYYYKARERFNDIAGGKSNKIERAALFLYFNRHSYNGLWRVNSNGRFNVPFGRYRRPYVPGADHINEFSGMLQAVEISNADFQSAIGGIKQGDFVYFDPPYIPVSHTARFTDYTKSGFTIPDQERLLETCRNLDRKGVKFLLSNSYTEENLDFYKEFQVRKVNARRSINCKGEKRSGHHELLVMNFEPDNRIGTQNIKEKN